MSSISFALAEYLTGLTTSGVPELVYVNAAPQGTVADHLVVTRYGTNHNNHLSGMGDLHSADFDIDCKSSDADVAVEIADAIKDTLDSLLGEPLNGDWICEACIINGLSEGYEPPPGDGQDISIYLATLEITLQYRSS